MSMFETSEQDFWRKYYEKQFKSSLVAIMRACNVEQISVSHADLTRPARLDMQESADGSRFFRIKDTFKLC